MTHDKDKILIRAKDIVLMISILTMLGMFLGPMRKIFKVEETILDVEKLKEEAVSAKIERAVTNTQLADMVKQLEQINWQLRRMSHGGRDGG